MRIKVLLSIFVCLCLGFGIIYFKQDDKKEIENKIEKEVEKVEKVRREAKPREDIDYEFEYDETIEDE